MNKKATSKKDIIQNIIIALLVVIAIILLIYTIIIKTNNNSSASKVIDISSDINTSMIEEFYTYRGPFNAGSDILDEVDNRLEYVNLVLIKNDLTKKASDKKSTNYVLYDTYKAKYEEIYGTNYDFSSDIKEASKNVYNDCSSQKDELFKNNNYVCFSAISNELEKITLTVEEKYIDSEEYALEGTTSTNDTFKITYSLTDDTFYLKNITF